MLSSNQVFVADTCIGGLSVIDALWKSGSAGKATFMADYAVNPLGVKSESEIAGVVGSWLDAAADYSDSLVIACNTLSIRYHQLMQPGLKRTKPRQVVSMVDCVEAMAKAEANILAGRKILVIGTEFTASQALYPDILAAAIPGCRVNTIAATELERKIARFELPEKKPDCLVDTEIAEAIEKTDAAVLACTCFPMVRSELEARFPDILFLDPGAYCSGLLERDDPAANRKLSIRVTGKVVPMERVVEFAGNYLDILPGSIVR